MIISMQTLRYMLKMSKKITVVYNSGRCDISGKAKEKLKMLYSSYVNETGK